MQQLMRTMGEGFLQIFLIQLLYKGIFVAEADHRAGIQLAQHLSALRRQLHAVGDGLSAAACAAAGTGHNLHKIILYSTGLDGAEQLAGISQPTGYRHLKADVSHLHGTLLPAFHAPHGAERVRMGIFTGYQIMGAAQCSLHHTAGGTKDHACSGAQSQRFVKHRLSQLVQEDAAGTQHTGHLSGGQHDIHIGACTGVADLGYIRLIFLGNTGHDGDTGDTAGIHPQLFGKIGFCHSAKHLLGRFGAGKVGQKVRKFMFDKAHPARAAAGEHGPAILVLVGKALQQFAAFLHNGQVGGKIGIEYIVKAQSLEGGDHSSHRRLMLAEPGVHTPGGTYRGSNLSNHNLIGIGNGVHHPHRIVPLMQGAHRAVGDTLATEGAVGIGKGFHIAEGNPDTGSGAHHVPYAQSLHLFAEGDAAHTFDALFGIPNQGQRYIPVFLPVGNLKGDVGDI